MDEVTNVSGTFGIVSIRETAAKHQGDGGKASGRQRQNYESRSCLSSAFMHINRTHVAYLKENVTCPKGFVSKNQGGTKENQ